MSCKIEKLDHENAAIRGKIFAFLTEYEPHSLFILGNLTMGFPQTYLYAAVEDGQWTGIAGYYALVKSYIPFSPDADVTRTLTRHIAAAHPQIEYVNGMDYAAEPAYEELLRIGYRPDNDPHKVFMEMTGLPPLQPWEASARQMQGGDRAEIARLLRCLGGTWDESRPVTEEEMERAGMNPLLTVITAHGRIVSTASTNGLGIRCYQVLGVATHPDFRGCGYAGSAVAALMRSMEKLGGRHAVLFTDYDNVSAQRCYRRLGFTATGRYYVAKLRTDFRK